MSEPDDELLVERRGPVATVTFNRPARKNAVTRAMWVDLRRHFEAFCGDPEVRAVVLTGADGDFCSGADLAGVARGEGPERHQIDAMREVGRAVLAVHDCTKPVVAKVRGVCVGAAVNVMLACDLALADPSARFSEIFARRGLSIDGGGSWLLPRAVGMQRAKRLVFTAEMVDAATAAAYGLVSEVVDADRLDATVDELVGAIVANPPIALSMSKRMLDAGMGISLAEALEAESMAQTVNFSTEDFAEAMNAFVAKRPPVFRGR